MARVRTKEEVEEIKLREKIKLSLVRQQLDLNRLTGMGGCPTARGKVYITSIFQKDGMLSVSRPHLALECQIRQHLNQKDVRMRRRAVFEPRLEEKDIREFCACNTFKDKCPAYRRFMEETDSVIVKRVLPPDEKTPTLKIEAAQRETLEPLKPPTPKSEAAAAAGTPTSPARYGYGQSPHKPGGYSVYNRPGGKPDPHGAHGHKAPPPRGRSI